MTKGGSEIFPYWITVLAVSAPFIYFMTQYSERFNLGKLEVMITTSLLCIHSLMFPSYMQKDHILTWGLLSGGILICPLGIAAIRSQRITSKNVASLEIKNTIDEVATVEMEEPVEEVITSVEVEEPVEEVITSVKVEEPVEEVTATVEREDLFKEVACRRAVDSREVEKLSLEGIIEKGFQAKEEGNYLLAAEWFIYALDRKPSSDIAFYLIIESYWHCKKGYSINEALIRLRPHIKEYIKNAPPEWLGKLTAWLEEEKVINDL